MKGKYSLILIAGGVGLSAAGDLLAITALLIHATQGATSQVSPEVAVVLLLAVPAMVSSLFGRPAGSIAARFSMKTVVVACSVGEAAIYALLATLTQGGKLPLVTILPLLAFDSVLTLIRSAGVQGTLPRVSDRPVSVLYGVLQAASTTGRLIGPAAGAALLSIFGVPGALIANSISFLLYAILIAFAALPPLLGTAGVSDRPKRTVSYRVVLTSGAGSVVVTVTLCIMFVIVVDAALVLYALQVLGAGPAGYAALSTCWAIGILISSRLPISEDRDRLNLLVVLASVSLAMALVVDAAVALLPVAIVAALLAGVAHGLQNRAAATVVAQEFDDQRRASSFAIFGALANGAVAAGLLLAGILLPFIGPRFVLFAGGIGAILAIGAGLAMRSLADNLHRREHDSHTPETDAN